HVHDEVLLHLEAPDGLDGDGLVETLTERLAGQPVDAVDHHGVRPADPVPAGPAQRKGAVDVPLHVVQGVEYPGVVLDVRDVEAPDGLVLGGRVEPLDLELDLQEALKPASLRSCRACPTRRRAPAPPTPGPARSRPGRRG